VEHGGVLFGVVFEFFLDVEDLLRRYEDWACLSTEYLWLSGCQVC